MSLDLQVALDLRWYVSPVEWLVNSDDSSRIGHVLHPRLVHLKFPGCVGVRGVISVLTRKLLRFFGRLYAMIGGLIKRSVNDYVIFILLFLSAVAHS